MIRSFLITVSIVASGLAIGAAAPSVGAVDDTPWRLPETPERCTTEEAESGDVGHCLLAFYDDPATTGWGAPPAPGVGPGWEWSGSSYSGSPALAQWEADRIAENTAQVASMDPGELETHVAAQPLFEGFLREIAANGYDVNYASGYSFRCTSGNGGWNCPSGDPDDLSNHAWGLAVDMNAGTNPIRRYERVDGLTACQTPMDTDLPRWVIQTAEAWGLYWGGYGWSRGCQTTETERDSVFRDPPHFEFRGTVDHARAIAEFNRNRVPLPPGIEPASCTLTIDADGAEVERCSRSDLPEAGWRLPVDTDAPADAVAAMINLTVTETDGPGFLTLEDCGPRSGPRSTSAINFAEADTVAAMAVVPLDETGRFCVFRSVGAHSIVDVLGFIGAGDEPLWFEPTIPSRLTDTREAGACAPLQECQAGPVPGGSVHAVPVEDERPRVANLTVVDGGAPGYVQAGTCDRIGPDHVFSNLNHVDEHARANLAIVDNGETGTCVYAMSETHVIVDELGALDATAGYGWEIDEARRVLDTRECSDTWCAERPDAHTVIEVDLGTEAPGAAIAVTVTDAAEAGFVTVAPCAEFGDEPVSTSNVNHRTGQTATNLALVDLSEGRVCVYTMAPAHLVIDVQAELTAEQVNGLDPIEPTRVHDSRG